MRINKKVISIIVLILSGTLFYFYKKGPIINELNTEKPVSSKDSKQPIVNQVASSSPINNNKSNNVTQNNNQNNDLLIEEFPKSSIESINFLTKVTNQIIKNNFPKEVLIKQLKYWKLAPTHSIDKNQYTGEMNMIRTQNGLPGTRYFHAQYFDGMLQHLSFEYQKNQKSFEQAIDTVKKQFNITTAPTTNNDNFISWPIENGRIVWIKRLDENDLKNNPFNAYSKDDIGTIKVAVELEIHGDNNESSDHDHQ